MTSTVGPTGGHHHAEVRLADGAVRAGKECRRPVDPTGVPALVIEPHIPATGQPRQIPDNSRDGFNWSTGSSDDPNFP